ncbi:MAG TPA: efflux RND transporter periplasmic adaptor subunit [Beijerinckiaceae bacterium]|nr:efflux RND transporter periplasmic adaptor subunit [Beijerinckiaceae bacterium]
MSIARSIILLVLAAAGGGYYWYSHQPTSPTATATASAQSTDGGGKSRANSQTVAVVTTNATSGDFPVRRRSIGYIEPIQTVAVKSRVQSELLEQHFTIGQMVKKGDLLFTLDDKEFQAAVDKDQATLEKDQAVQVRAEADLKRDQQLFARNAGTQQTVDQAVADEKSAVANVAGDRASLEEDQLRLSYTKIYAPITGRVGNVTVTPGNLVNANDSGPGFVTITQMQPIRVTFTLPESNLDEIKKAAAGSSPPKISVKPNGTDTTVDGALDFIDSSVDTTSGTVTLKAEFANQDLALWPGQYVDVAVDVGMHSKATIVPTVAIQIGQRGPYVFVVKPDETVEIRDIKTGEVDGDRTEVTAGLTSGEKIVVDGQANLANGSHVREGKSVSESPPANAADNQGQKS